MKKLSLFRSPLVLVLSTIVLFSSCKKINEATELGDELMPRVDNINTFETSFETLTNNFLFTDTAEEKTLEYQDNVALGNIINDPEFGATNASVYFGLSAPGTSASTGSNGTYPFTSKENLIIDSVVLSLSYTRAYADSIGMQTVRVYEIASTSGFNESTGNRFTDPDIETTGAELGSQTFSFNTLDDSISIIRKDTVKTANVLRIRLDNALGYRLASFDTAQTPNGGYYNDSLFRRLFPGLAIRPDAGMGNGLAFFNLADVTKTNLTVYYRATKGGVKDTASAVYAHIRNGQANIIKRTPGGQYASHLSNGTEIDEQLYLQSTPGSYASVKIPSLDTFSNNVIHRAELIVTRIPSALDGLFTPPTQLFLDKINATGDSAFILQSDLLVAGTPSFQQFGGQLKDNVYKFNITKHVQDIISRKEPNRTLRLYAPYFAYPFGIIDGGKAARIPIQTAAQPAYGRVVLAGGTFSDPSLRLRLRIVYSKI